MFNVRASEKCNHKYGARIDIFKEKLMIEDSDLLVDVSDLFIRNKRYAGMRGLHEVLFERSLKKFT